MHKDPYVWPFNAWDIKADYVEKTPRTLRVSHVETTVDGAGPCAARCTAAAASRSTSASSSRPAATSCASRPRSTGTRSTGCCAPSSARPTTARPCACEIQFGHIERVTTERDSVEKAQFEICAHKWIATEDAGGGFALLNDGKYGHRAKNGLLSLNLLRSPTFPDKTADRGIHRFTYAFCPFESGDLAKVVREGYRLNNPLRITDGGAFDSFAAVDDAGVIVETVKRAEHGDGVVLRLYESLGTPDHDGAPGRPAPPHRARDRPARAALRGRAISGGSRSARSRSRRSCWRTEP